MLVAYQITFDLVETEMQSFLIKVGPSRKHACSTIMAHTGLTATTHAVFLHFCGMPYRRAGACWAGPDPASLPGSA